MKRALFKDIVIEIKNTRKRFISILLMALLGVGFFAGLKASSPDMKKTIDNYYDEHNLYDIEVISTLGLTDEDNEKIRQIEGIENSYLVYSKDISIQVKDKENIVKIYSIKEDINKVILQNGKMPETYDECLVEDEFLRENKLSIGDTININCEEDFFKTKELKIVGTVKSPLYISRSRGTTSLGSGTIDYCAYVMEDNITSDYYTEIYATVKNAKKLNTCSSEYEKLIDNVVEKIEDIKEERQNARYNELVNEANKKIEDAQIELDEKKKEGEEKISTAEAELSNAKEKIQTSKFELNSQKNKAYSEINNFKRQIDQSKQQLEEAKNSLANNEVTVNQSIETINKSIEEQSNNLSSINNSLQQLNEKYNLVENEEEKIAIENNINELNSNKSSIEMAIAQLENKKNELNSRN